MGSVTTAHPAFRVAEKHFKNRATPALPALRDLPGAWCRSVLDLSRPPCVDEDEVWRAGWWGRAYEAPVPGRRMGKGKARDRTRGERPPVPDLNGEGVRVVRLSDGRLGFVVAEDADAQEGLALAALAEYTRAPNPRSLDTHYDLPPDPFSVYASAPDTPVPPRHLSLPDEEREALADAARANAGVRTLIETAPASTMGYTEVKRRNAGWTGDAMSLKAGTKSVEALFREMRWTNLGWVYQWSTKSYDFSTDDPILFPPEVARLCRNAVGAVPWHEVFDGVADVPDYTAWPNDYDPDTGIVNFYQTNDTLMAHVDRSELDNSRPLVSISLGHAAVFLLGSDVRDDPPRPIILRSGDVLIMAGRGRQAYHGVPRILEDSLPAHFQPHDGDGRDMTAVKRFMSTARININARQVFPPGFKRPERILPEH